PPGTTANNGAVRGSPATSAPPSSPLTTSFTVPSPPWAMISPALSATAAAAMAVACPRWAVSTTSSFTSLASACASTSRPPGVVAVACGFTTRTARMTAAYGPTGDIRRLRAGREAYPTLRPHSRAQPTGVRTRRTQPTTDVPGALPRRAHEVDRFASYSRATSSFPGGCGTRLLVLVLPVRRRVAPGDRRPAGG